jgi:hypothetical protein
MGVWVLGSLDDQGIQNVKPSEAKGKLKNRLFFACYVDFKSI